MKTRCGGQVKAINFLGVFGLTLIISACNEPGEKIVEDLEERITDALEEVESNIPTKRFVVDWANNISESSVFTLDPLGASYAVGTDEQCSLNFASASKIPDDFFQSTEATFTSHQVLDTCLGQVPASEELGRLYFSKNQPSPGGPNPHKPGSSGPTTHGMTVMSSDDFIPGLMSEEKPHHTPSSHMPTDITVSDFLQLALSFKGADEAQAFLGCMSTGLKDYFDRALKAHGNSQSGYLVDESADTVHVHYDLTVFGIMSYVVQLVKVVEASGKNFVVFTTSSDSSADDAELFSHTGVNISCE
jgi:hypothetical protein